MALTVQEATVDITQHGPPAPAPAGEQGGAPKSAAELEAAQQRLARKRRRTSAEGFDD